MKIKFQKQKKILKVTKARPKHLLKKIKICKKTLTLGIKTFFNEIRYVALIIISVSFIIWRYFFYIVTNLLRNKINELVLIQKRKKKTKSSSRKF